MSRQSPISPPVAQALHEARAELALALVDSVSDWEKYSSEIAAATSREEFAARETLAFVDYLGRYFLTGDETYRNLYLGEKLKQSYIKEDGPQEAIARRLLITGRDRQSILEVAAARLQPAERDLLAATLDAMHGLITRPAERLCRVLLIGDCLYLDLMAFLTVPLLEAGVQLVPTFATSKRPGALRAELAQHQDRQFDLVFYSPLTYEFHPRFAELQTVRGALRPPAAVQEAIEAAKRDIESTLTLVEASFECPIFVHNTLNIRRHDGTARERLKNLLTRPARGYGRSRINTWLPACLEKLNANSHRHLFLLDEALAASGSADDPSRYLYHSGLQHPARLAQALAPAYRDIIAAEMLLAKKKLIICDLDNTLWKGVIGEGSVEHHADRQSTLRALRHKGVLLAICSKNDPKNVHWRGAMLSEEDFVCGRINWAPKVANIRQIAAQLNLKTKDFVFIDDRADERELVKQAFPEITVLDAESPAIWRQLAVVAETLSESTEGDRTRAYAERETRQQFLAQTAQSSALAEKLGVSLEVDLDSSEREALSGLELRLSIRTATQKDLKRVSELINRTNQFNLCGSRTSLREVTEWRRSDAHEILVAEARDKFGAMGIISVAVLQETARGVEIPVFVLSCRVFGFGMETALLNCIRNWRPGRALYGHFKETPYNQPCHKVYPQNGFDWRDGLWVSVEGREIADPPWLAVESPSFNAAQEA